MNFQYKLKYYNSEDGEYTMDMFGDQGVIEKIILNHWSGEHLPNGLKLIVITNKNVESIILEHAGKEVFEVYFLPLNRRFHYHKKSRIELIYDSFNAFLDNDLSRLETSLNRTTNENRYIRKIVQTNDFRYEVDSKRLWSQVNQTVLFGVPIGIFFIIMSIALLIELPHGSLLDLGIPFILFIGIYLWLPGLVLHSQYRKDNKHLIVRLSKGNNIIFINMNGLEKNLLKKDIEKMTAVNNPWHKMPWSDYGYTQVEFKSGDVLNLTNLIIDQFLIDGKFPDCKILKRQTIFPNLKRQTLIKF